MAPEGRRANQQGIAGADGLDQLIRSGKLTVNALHTHPRFCDPLGKGIRNRGGVAIGTREQKGN